MSLKRSAERNFAGGLVLATIVGSIFLILNLPYDYVEIGGTRIGDTDLSGLPSQRFDQIPSMAGWPLRYWVHYEASGFEQVRLWSPIRLVLDIIIGMLSAVIVFTFTRIRASKIGLARNPALTQTLFDLGLASAILLIPLSLLAVAYRRTVEHENLANRIGQRGVCFLSCWFPKRIADHVPGGLVPWLHRIRVVQCIQTNDELIQKVCKTTTLMRLESYFGRFEGASLEALRDRHFFIGLTLQNQKVGTAELETITHLPWLSILNLSNTNVDEPFLRRMDSMTGLTWLNLTSTNLNLAKLGKPAWSSTIQSLSLPRPTAGMADSLEIEGWPNLQTLTVTNQSLRRNEALLSLRLVDLPQLETLRLDRTQKHKLYAKNLPLLTRISDEVLPAYYLTDSHIPVPGLSWFTDLHLEELPSLKDVQCYARDLVSFHLDKTSSLRSFEIGSYLLSTLGTRRFESIEPTRCQSWIDQLGLLHGPAVVSLAGLPLEDIDLSPLANNRHVQELSIHHSVVTFDQVRSIATMKRLSKIDLGSCEIEADELAWFVERFPELSSLRINGSRLSKIDLVDRDKLRFVETSSLQQLDRFRIVNQPDLTASFRFEHAPRHFEIRNAKSLRGLSVAQPWPASAVMTGLRDLKWFAAGGKAVDDALLDTLLACPYLDQLTLAYPSISRSKLRRIGEFSNLSVLAIPGAGVDDSIAKDWRNLKSLWEIVLDDNQVGVATLAWLSQIESLRTLSLNRVKLDAAAIESLDEFNQLATINLSGVELPSDSLMTLLQNETLESIDLSYTAIDAKMLDRISQSRSLRFVNLRGCDLSEDQIRSLLDGNVRLAVAWGNDEDNPKEAAPISEALRQTIAGRLQSVRPRELVNQVESVELHEFALPTESSGDHGAESITGSSGTEAASEFRGFITIDLARIDLNRMRELVMASTSADGDGVSKPAVVPVRLSSP